MAPCLGCDVHAQLPAMWRPSIRRRPPFGGSVLPSARGWGNNQTCPRLLADQGTVPEAFTEHSPPANLGTNFRRGYRYSYPWGERRPTVYQASVAVGLAGKGLRHPRELGALPAERSTGDTTASDKSSPSQVNHGPTTANPRAHNFPAPGLNILPSTSSRWHPPPPQW